jgi:hypothetical protein
MTWMNSTTVTSSHTSMNVSQKKSPMRWYGTEVCALGALLKHAGPVKGLAKELDINESCLEKLADEVRKDLGYRKCDFSGKRFSIRKIAIPKGSTVPRLLSVAGSPIVSPFPRP